MVEIRVKEVVKAKTVDEEEMDYSILEEYNVLKRKVRTIKRLLDANPEDEIALILAKRYKLA